MMILESLTTQLRHAKPMMRIMAINTLAMGDEVRALDAISLCIPEEPDARVEAVFKQVGRDLAKLKRDGYDTVQAICEHFSVYSEVIRHADDEEIKELQRMSHQVSDKRKDDDFNDKVVMAASLAITARVMGASAMLGAMVPQVGPSSNMGSSVEAMQKLKTRVKATIPSQASFQQWVPLLTDSDPEQRRQGAIQLSSTYNPDVLPYLAQLMVNDVDDSIKETAKRLGRNLYWNTVYYEMEQDGTIKRIMEEFAFSLGITLPDEKRTTSEIPVAPVAQESIEEILAKAEARRAKKGLRR